MIKQSLVTINSYYYYIFHSWLVVDVLDLIICHQFQSGCDVHEHIKIGHVTVYALVFVLQCMFVYECKLFVRCKTLYLFIYLFIYLSYEKIDI